MTFCLYVEVDDDSNVGALELIDHLVNRKGVKGVYNSTEHDPLIEEGLSLEAIEASFGDGTF